MTNKGMDYKDITNIVGKMWEQRAKDLLFQEPIFKTRELTRKEKIINRIMYRVNRVKNAWLVLVGKRDISHD